MDFVQRQRIRKVWSGLINFLVPLFVYVLRRPKNSWLVTIHRVSCVSFYRNIFQGLSRLCRFICIDCKYFSFLKSFDWMFFLFYVIFFPSKLIQILMLQLRDQSIIFEIIILNPTYSAQKSLQQQKFPKTLILIFFIIAFRAFTFCCLFGWSK